MQSHTAMKHRKLRIAWSVAWGIGVVLLITLWVRTIHRQDKVAVWITHSKYLYADAFEHWMEVAVSTPATQPAALFASNYPTYYYSNFVANPTPLTLPVHQWYVGHAVPPFTPGIMIRIPFWATILLSIFIGGLPWTVHLPETRRLQPPYSASCHDAGCCRAEAGRLGGTLISSAVEWGMKKVTPPKFDIVICVASFLPWRYPAAFFSHIGHGGKRKITHHRRLSTTVPNFLRRQANIS